MANKRKRGRTRRRRKRKRVRRRRRSARRTHSRRRRSSRSQHIWRRRRRRRTRGRRRRRRRTVKRGGYSAGRLYPAPAFPTGGPYRQGTVMGARTAPPSELYYPDNRQPLLPDPKGGNGTWKAAHAQQGGYAPFWQTIVDNVPGGTDLQDQLWSAQAAGKNAINTWFGNPPVNSPSPSSQPALDINTTKFYPSPDMSKVATDASTFASKFKIGSIPPAAGPAPAPAPST